MMGLRRRRAPTCTLRSTAAAVGTARASLSRDDGRGEGERWRKDGQTASGGFGRFPYRPWLQVRRTNRQCEVHLRFTEQAFQVEAPGVHLQFAGGIAGPEFPRSIAIQLDAVVVGIPQIDRLAYAVIGCTFQRNSGGQDSSQSCGERRTSGIDDR